MPPWDAYKNNGDGPWVKYGGQGKSTQKPSEKNTPSSLADFFKSIPRGVVGGVANTAAAEGAAEMASMTGGDSANMPTAEQGEHFIEANITGPLHKPEGAAGRIGESVGEALGTPASYLVPGGAISKLAAAAGSGLGSGVGGEIAGESGKFIGGLLGGGASGIAGAEQKASQLSRRLPTVEQIKQAGTAAYEAVKQVRLKASSDSIDKLLADARQALDDDLIVDTSAPRTFRAVDKLQSAGGDIAQIMGVRQKLNEIGPQEGTEYVAANHVKKAIDRYIETLDPKDVVSGDPKLTQALLDHARSNWRVYRKVDEIEQAQELAKHRAKSTGTGANEQNALRQEIRKILDSDKKSRGYSPEAKAQMEKIVEGSWLSNLARSAGKYAPSGPVSATTAILTGIGLGPQAGAAVGLGGFLTKHLGTYLTKRQIRELADIIRKESPIGRPIAKETERQQPRYGAVLPAAGIRSMALPLNVSDTADQSLPGMLQ